MITSYFVKNKKYYEVFIKLRDSNGNQLARRKRGLLSEKLAKEVEFQLKNELLSQADTSSSWTWKAWHEECLRRMSFERKKSTVIAYEGGLLKWMPKSWEKKPLAEISKNDVFKVVFVEFPSVLNENSRKTFLKKLRRIFEMAVEDGVISVNPTKGMKVTAPQKMKQVLTAEEADKFLKAAKIEEHPFYPIWAVALMTGMRSGEMFALKWQDIDLDAGTISVNKQWTRKDGFGPTKTRDTRVVPISKQLSLFLKERKLSHPSKDFVLPHLTAWVNGEQAQVLKSYCEAIGITPVRFHDLRATFITNLLAQGVPLVTVMSKLH